MKLKHAGFREGVLWVRSGFRVFFRFPLAFTGLFMMFMLGGFMLVVLPLVGPLLLLTALPVVTLGFMLGTQRALQGRVPLPDVFVEPLRADRARRLQLLKLGALYAGAVVLAVLLISAIDGDRLERWQAAVWQEAQQSASGQVGSAEPSVQPAPPPAADAASQVGAAEHALIDNPQLQFSVLLRVLIALPLSLVFWHAPALVYWGGVPVGKSLFFSAVACWRNFGAFIGYGLAWAGVVLAFGVAAGLLFRFLGQPQFIALAVTPAALMFSTVFYASLYFTFVDSFSAPTDAAPDSEHDTTLA